MTRNHQKPALIPILETSGWTTNYIARIDPASCKIVGLIDLTTLFLKARKENPRSEATNGIAYGSKRDRVYVTGKFWPYIFEIKIED